MCEHASPVVHCVASFVGDLRAVLFETPLPAAVAWRDHPERFPVAPSTNPVGFPLSGLGYLWASILRLDCSPAWHTKLFVQCCDECRPSAFHPARILGCRFSGIAVTHFQRLTLLLFPALPAFISLCCATDAPSECREFVHH